MAYTTKDATKTLFKYLNINTTDIEFIDNTNNRGFIYTTALGEKCAIFIYPISHKSDNSKNFFDTRDSGAAERCTTWNYAINNNIKYFCFAVHDRVDKYIDYIFSLECAEDIIQKVSGTINGPRSGTQVVIPNMYVPSKPFERIQTKNGFYLAVINKDYIYDYIEKFDNRPYLNNNSIIGIMDESYDTPIKYKTDFQSKLQFERNRIIFGAPGTGKSHKLKKDCDNLLDNTTGNYERVTFHPDYSYSHFVGTYKPVTDDSNSDIKYEFVPGPFIRIYIEALRSAQTDNPQPYILLIEEINRAKVAAVFGDIFQLLDRDDNGVSEYSIHTNEDVKKYLAKELNGSVEDFREMKLPNNLFIWATMNSADQGVFPMDTAFKRRWSFEYLDIDKNDNDINGKIILGTGSHEMEIEWNKLRKAINDILACKYKVNEDKLLGPYFLSPKVIATNSETDHINDSKKFIEAFKNKILMYLYEDAAKMHKHKLFAGCNKNGYTSTKFSSICNAFDELGIDIFEEEFRTIYNDQKDNA